MSASLLQARRHGVDEREEPRPEAQVKRAGVGRTGDGTRLELRMRSFAAMLLLLGVAFATKADPDPGAREILSELPPDLVGRLEQQGSVVLQELRRAGGRDGYILAFVIFHQPPARVFELLGQTWRQTEFRPEVSRIESIERTPDGSLDEHHLRILFTDVHYRLRYRRDEEASQISWKLDPAFANDLQRVEGFWQLYPLSERRTLGRLGTIVDVGPMLPGFLQDLVTRKNLPQTVERCRRWVDGGGQHVER